MRFGAMILLACGGCMHESQERVCVLEAEPVADSVEIAGVSASALVAVGEGTWTVPGTYADGGEAEVTVEVVRTGEAERVTATVEIVSTFSPGVGKSMVDVDPICADHVRVPVALAITTADGLVSAEAATYLAVPMGSEGSEIAGAGATAPYDVVEMPDVGDRSDFDEVEAAFGASFPLDGGPISGGIGWMGRKTFDEGQVRTSWEEVLDF